MKKTLKGNLSVSAPFSSPKVDYVVISLEDESSGTRFVEARIKYADFAKALVGNSQAPMEFELYADHVGEQYEFEQREVFVPESPFDERETCAQAAVKLVEADGWAGEWKDALNHRRYIRGATVDGVNGRYFRIRFGRFVNEANKGLNENES
jgi:hypothetical protein